MMGHTLTSKERFALLHMVFDSDAGGEMVSATPLEMREWKPLERAGFVELTKRKNPETKRLATFVTLTDRAWASMNENLAGPVWETKQAARLLSRILARVSALLDRHDETLASLVSQSVASDDATPAGEGAARVTRSRLSNRVREVCLQLGGGRARERIRLRELRALLSDLSREEVDNALKELQAEHRLNLLRLDNPAEVTPEDEAAALLVAGNPRHILYLEA